MATSSFNVTVRCLVADDVSSAAYLTLFPLGCGTLGNISLNKASPPLTLVVSQLKPVCQYLAIANKLIWNIKRLSADLLRLGTNPHEP